jgi:hypothetical protein
MSKKNDEFNLGKGSGKKFDLGKKSTHSFDLTKGDDDVEVPVVVENSNLVSPPKSKFNLGESE